MTESARIQTHWRNLPADELTNQYLARRCDQLTAEFPEADSFEISLQVEGKQVEGHAHVDGKRTRLAAHTRGALSSRQAAERVLDKLEREMRKEHDKRIFSARRKAQKSQVKRHE